MLFRKYALSAAIVTVLWALWLLWLWQPERQVRLHTTHFLKKVEQRNWEAAGSLMAADFTDRWGHTKDTALQDAREVFQQFLFLTIENRTVYAVVYEHEGSTDTVVKISGNGGPVAELVMGKVNALRQPFSFSWRRGHTPWDWQLIHIDQSELNLDANGPF